jgi:hypothetical protein
MAHYGILASVAIGVVYLVVNSLISAYSRHRRAQELGCKTPDIRRNKLPGGIDFVLRLIDAEKRDQVPNEFVKIAQEQGRDTWEQSLWGKPQIFTTNPKNVQAVLATQFHDFEIGTQRKQVFFPMLGSGIFTQDGKDW